MADRHDRWPIDVRFVALCLRGSARTPRLKEELSKHGLLECTTIVENERDHEDGLRGCFQSHQKACAEFLVDERLCVLVVFEDDVVFEERRNMSVSRAISEAIEGVRGASAQQVAIGGVPVSPLRHRHGAVYATMFQMTHAYAIGKKGAMIVRDLRFSCSGRIMRMGDHLDQHMSRALTQAVVFPSVAFQRAAIDATTSHSSSYIYYALTVLRDLVGQRSVQVCLEFFFWVLGRLADAWALY